MLIQRRAGWRRWLALFTVAGLVFAGVVPFAAETKGSSSVYAEETAADSLQKAFADAAGEFGVPESVLLSVSYHLSRWEHHKGEPSISGGYGLMHLTDVDEVHLHDHDKGEVDEVEVIPDGKDPSLHTLDAAAKLVGERPEVLKKDPVQNIRGAAALLARYARETTGGVPVDAADWYGAVAKYSGSKEEAVALDFADQVYQSIREGVDRQTPEGQQVRLVSEEIQPNRSTAKPLKLRNNKGSEADCPNGLDCRFIPAAYEQRSSDPEDYSNYDVADRPRFGPEIRYIVIHDTEGSYQGSINWFANPWSSVSAHYVLRSSDGQVTQMVNNKDVAWQAGNWYFNMHTIGIEHEGYAMEGATWYTEKMYRASAKLVRHLAEKYDIPLDRAHIIGHDEIPGLTPARQGAMHWDPGPFWDWEHYMELLGAPITPARGSKQVITFKPGFRTNRPIVEGAEPQPANFVYLHTAPDFDAPLLDDPALPGLGTRKGSDWGDKGRAGQTFYLADRRGGWDAIWHGGQKAWFYNPHQKYTVRGKGTLITPKKGKASIPVYGGAYPEDTAYPPEIAPREHTPLQYTIPAGQIYVAEEKVNSDYYHASVFTHDPYANHKLVTGNDEYYRIHFNHRYAFVKASDVEVIPHQ